MGNKIYKQSQMSKANHEFENGSYHKCIQILKEELKFHPRSKEGLRLVLKAYLRLYEIDRADEVYQKFYPQGSTEDILTKSVYIKETLFYDEAKARFMGKELQQQLERMKYNNNTSALKAQQKDQSLQNQQTNQQQVNNLSTSNNNNNNMSQSVASEIIITSESLSFSKVILKYLDSQFDSCIKMIQNDIISQGSLINAQIKFDSQIIMIMAYNKLKQYKNSLSLIQELKQPAAALTSDKNFEINTMCAETYSALGKIEQAIDTFKQCLEIIPVNTYVMFRLFNLCVKLNDLRQSRSYLERAFKNRPNDSLCYKMQGDHYIIMKDTKNAMKMFEKGITINKKCFRCYETLGDISPENQRLSYYERCSKCNPCYSDVMIKIGIHYLQHSDDYLEALRWFFKALENRSQHKLIYFYISRSYYSNEQYEYALKNLSISLNLTYEKINDQLSLSVKILNKYSEFFKPSLVIDFIQNIRFKYFQYFPTIAQNLDNVQFAKLFSNFIAPTQAQLQFFALYKLILNQSNNPQLSVIANIDNEDIGSSMSLQENLNSYLIKTQYTPINQNAIDKAQQYYLDILTL
ncbi:hypothetical protein ABPG74_005359 [Tetrahymena malaccensis]